MQAPADLLGQRHARVRQLLEQHQLDGLLTANPPNVFYLTNLAASSAVVLVTRAQLYLLTDFRYSSAVHRLIDSAEGPLGAIFRLVDSSYDEAVVELLATLDPGRYGFESAHVPVKQHAHWSRSLANRSTGCDLQPADSLVEGLRAVKDAFEIRVMTEAAARISDVARNILGTVVAQGATELELAADIDWRIKRAGFDRTAFDTIVASGPNSALPHAHPTRRRLQAGDLAVLDFGGVFHGYCVDLTRTVAVGEPSAEQKRMYRAVLEAQRAAIRTVRPGVGTHEVDSAARRVLGEAGLAEAFGHSTGHGLGLDVHEAPRLGRLRPGVEATNLVPGMICTVEPGAYVAPMGGIRLEDDVLVTEGPCTVLTDVPFDDRLM